MIIRGADGAFAAGTDIAEFTGFSGADDGVAYERRVGEVLRQLAAIEIPVIAAVDGPAVGGGLAIAASADLIIASDRSRFGVPIARTLGNCLPAAVLARLRERLGAGPTLAMLITARPDHRRPGPPGRRWSIGCCPGRSSTPVSRGWRNGSPPARRLSLAAIKALDRRLAAAGVEASGRGPDPGLLRQP